MTVLIAVLVLMFMLYLGMIGLVFGSGIVEGRKRPEEQRRPEEPKGMNPVLH